MGADFRSAAIALAILCASFGTAWAEDLDATTTQNDPGHCNVPTDEQAQRGCICMLPIASPPPEGVVLLEKIKGSVLKSNGEGFTPVKDPTWLNVGDTVLVKASSKATLDAGMNCQREIGPNASLVIKEIDSSCACAALIAERHVAAVPLHGLLAAGAAAGAIAVVVGMQVSP